MTKDKDQFLKEKVMLEHYFASKRSEEDQKEANMALQQVMRRIEVVEEVAARDKKERGRRAMIVGLISGAVAMLALVVCLSVFSRHSKNGPIQVYIAENVTSDDVVWQHGNNGFEVLDKEEYNADELISRYEEQISKENEQNLIEAAEEPIEEELQIVTTPARKTVSLTLCDGSVVHLNAGSQLSFPSHFSSTERIVNLRGEAFFEVAKDAQKPFIVKTQDMETMVFGTEFNVRRYSADDCHVTLVDGSVKVKTNSGEESMLLPGQDARLLESGNIMVEDIDTDIYCAWHNGFFYMDSTLENVAREIGRWFNCDVVFDNDDKLALKVHYQASRDASVEDAIELLNSLGKASFKIKKDVILVE